MDPRWPASLALVIGLVLLAWDAPQKDEQQPSPPENQGDPGGQPPADDTTDAHRMQRFQFDPNFKSFEVTPPPPMTPPPDGAATPAKRRTLQSTQTLTPPPANQGPPQ